MAKGTSVKLGEHFDDFIARQLKAGRYGNASEVIRDGLRLLEKEQLKLEALKEALRIGKESGPAKPFDREKFRQKMRVKHDKNL